ncbi:hypothetical protein K443DRAFT_507220 [Laccaria amethystina LaAM-08-1]|uniref:Uncharacterized protein n=1 Tax=Laccaria amethystina LaAM-08-1 TaxID=1095629 RepID=A0A0C9X0S0_9AGAR|nr:hypothetical protein K443DRAFT_507220 [Laccaria amethystina LaAM-08-1]
MLQFFRPDAAPLNQSKQKKAKAREQEILPSDFELQVQSVRYGYPYSRSLRVRCEALSMLFLSLKNDASENSITRAVLLGYFSSSTHTTCLSIASDYPLQINRWQLHRPSPKDKILSQPCLLQVRALSVYRLCIALELHFQTNLLLEVNLWKLHLSRKQLLNLQHPSDGFLHLLHSPSLGYKDLSQPPCLLHFWALSLVHHSQPNQIRIFV